MKITSEINLDRVQIEELKKDFGDVVEASETEFYWHNKLYIGKKNAEITIHDEKFEKAIKEKLLTFNALIEFPKI
jgi:hypothetical protein